MPNRRTFVKSALVMLAGIPLLGTILGVSQTSKAALKACGSNGLAKITMIGYCGHGGCTWTHRVLKDGTWAPIEPPIFQPHKAMPNA